jgi:hypothetical protein
MSSPTGPPAAPVQKRGTDCAVHRHWDNVPLEDHHIFPKEFGGKTFEGNLIRVCANAHSDIHYYIALLVRFNGLVPWNIERTFGKSVRTVAQQGYNSIRTRHDQNQMSTLRGMLNERYGIEGQFDTLVLTNPAESDD